MKIDKFKNNGKLKLVIEGRIDTQTSPELENVLKGVISDISELIFDFSKVSYISSAGLRVLLMAHKTMNEQEKMSVVNVSDDILEIFELTGFTDILTIEPLSEHYEKKL